MSDCKSCGAPVEWKKIDGRWYCHNAGTQTDHWDSCSKRRWQQTVSTGERFDNLKLDKKRTASGYKNSIHGMKFDHIEVKSIKGKHYKPDGCDCGRPPWELCKPDCKHAIDFKEAA
jgi:hypothetical protein